MTRRWPFVYSGEEARPEGQDRRDGLVLALAGLQLTRKAQASHVARERGYLVVSTGDVVRSNAAQAHRNAGFEQISAIATKYSGGRECDLLEELEPLIVAGLERYRGVVVDSVKSVDGVRFLLDRFADVVVIGFLASYAFRLLHSRLRAREDDPMSPEEFDLRDRREAAMGLANVVVFSDFFLVAGDVETSRAMFGEILNRIERGERG